MLPISLYSNWKSRDFAAAIHGNKSQTARQNALDDFKSSKIKVLVATDIAAEELILMIFLM
jgi:superfamily II DNA/RNA helicase